jgi:PAS domain S-box-containing protein
MEPILKPTSSLPPIVLAASGAADARTGAPGDSAFGQRAAEGEMARRVREFDWASTALGPAERWSPALKWTVGLVLASGFPKALRWGSELILIYNDSYRPILGDKHPGVLGKPLREAWWEIYDALGPLNEDILSGRRPAFFAEDLPWRVQRHGSEWEDARFTISYSPVPDETVAGGIGGVLTTVVETTERVRAEAALRASEEALIELNDTLEAQVAQKTRERDRIWRVSEDLLGVSDFEGYFTSVNPAWTAVLGWSEDEIRAMHVRELRHPDDAPHSEAGRARLRKGVPTVRMENRFRHKDGSWRWIYWTLTAQDDLIYLIGRHITAEKEAAEALHRAEDQLRQAQKMEAIGQLTGGIAHDFNNLLTGILGSLEMLQARVRQGRVGEVGRYVDAAVTSANRAAALTHRLLAFARRQPLDPRPLDVNKLVASMEDLLRRSIGETIAMEFAAPPELWLTYCDRNQLETVLLNLAINARDAMPSGGKLAIGTRNCEVDEIASRYLDLEPGEYVCMTVADTGTGMTPDVIARAFDPFFTTKPIGQGTGLGLSMVYGFAKQSGGHVRIESAPGQGATVELYLPRYAGTERQDAELATGAGPGELPVMAVQTLERTEGGRGPQAGLPLPAGERAGVRGTGLAGTEADPGTQAGLPLPAAERAGVRGTGLAGTETDPGTQARLPLPAGEKAGVRGTGLAGTVLVIEDEAAVRELVLDLLAELGLAALAATDGPAALTILQSAARIELVVTDVGLPGMNGRALADAARKLRPDLKFLFITGYAEDAAQVGGFLAPGMAMVTKPFAIDVLATRIREMLGGDASEP